MRLCGCVRVRVHGQRPVLSRHTTPHATPLTAHTHAHPPQVLGILFAFYLLFHIGSYVSLSKLYKQKR